MLTYIIIKQTLVLAIQSIEQPTSFPQTAILWVHYFIQFLSFQQCLVFLEKVNTAVMVHYFIAIAKLILPRLHRVVGAKLPGASSNYKRKLHLS